MTIKEAIVKSLEDIKGFAASSEIYDHIIEKKLYSFGAKNPKAIVTGEIRDLILKNDSRIRKHITENNKTVYYSPKYNDSINFGVIEQKVVKSGFHERDLHILLATYLKSIGVYAKTIQHETSRNSEDNNLNWIHPDMVGVKLDYYKSKINHQLIKSLDINETFKLYSFELKKVVLNDYDLKRFFFQAVSNSSWSNRGYLVALKYNQSLMEEMSRLNQAFGIGFIELGINPFESKMLFQSKLNSLDFKTIDKLCLVNDGFEKVIEYLEKLLDASDKYYDVTLKDYENFSDKVLMSEEDITLYINKKGIN